MEKGNVLVIGNTGAGKSTLINAVLGEKRAPEGSFGSTKDLYVYTGEHLPFRVIDSIGFDPSPFKGRHAVNAVKKWSKDCAKAGNADSQINVIWYCLDGTARKQLPKTLDNLSKATSFWSSVPVIVVITKSYVVAEREANILLVRRTLAKMKKRAANVKLILPVVARAYSLNVNAYAPPEGISELINATCGLMPEGMRAAREDVAAFVLKRNRVMAQGVTALATGAAVLVAAVPIPFPDAALLAPTEIAEVNAIAKIYGIRGDEKYKRMLNSIVQVGTVSTAARTLISTLKAVPGINIGAITLNAIIAGGIAAGMGEASSFIFEQISLGNRSVDDIDWVRKVLESELTSTVLRKLQEVVGKTDGKMTAKDITDIITGVFLSKKKK